MATMAMENRGRALRQRGSVMLAIFETASYGVDPRLWSLWQEEQDRTG